MTLRTLHILTKLSMKYDDEFLEIAHRLLERHLMLFKILFFFVLFLMFIEYINQSIQNEFFGPWRIFS